MSKLYNVYCGRKMGEETIYSLGNSMLLTNFFGEDKVFTIFFFCCTNEQLQQLCRKSHVCTAGRLLCCSLAGQVQPQKGDKARQATTARLTESRLAPYAVGLTSKLSFIQKH